MFVGFYTRYVPVYFPVCWVPNIGISCHMSRHQKHRTTTPAQHINLNCFRHSTRPACTLDRKAGECYFKCNCQFSPCRSEPLGSWLKNSLPLQRIPHRLIDIVPDRQRLCSVRKWATPVWIPNTRFHQQACPLCSILALVRVWSGDITVRIVANHIHPP